MSQKAELDCDTSDARAGNDASWAHLTSYQAASAIREAFFPAEPSLLSFLKTGDRRLAHEEPRVPRPIFRITAELSFNPRLFLAPNLNPEHLKIILVSQWH
jgi:hypothetical protein